MLARHTNELMLRLDQVADIGFAHIRSSELLTWYEKERITVSIWRDILAKWEELLEEWSEDERNSPLLVGEPVGGYSFIWGNGLTTSKKSWYKDVRDLARAKNESESAKAA
jgi:hypothetical protein